MKESYIAAKERWARKMAGQHQATVRSTDRLPPGQRQVHWNGNPLSMKHGGPARVIIPKRYAWKGSKFIPKITFLDRDILGFFGRCGAIPTRPIPGPKTASPSRNRHHREFHDVNMPFCLPFLPSLRDLDDKNGALPSVKTLGYFQKSLRDRTAPLFNASTL